MVAESNNERPGIFAFIDVRDEGGREWTAGVLLSPLMAKDGSGDTLDPSEPGQVPRAITAFRVVTR